MNYISAATAVLFAALSLPNTGFSAPKERARLIAEWKELALQQCLSTNYQAINAFDKRAARDASFWTYHLAKSDKWTPTALTSLNNWVDDKTSGYHSATIPLKADSMDKPANAIFAKCMTFYRSSELSNYLRELLKKEALY